MIYIKTFKSINDFIQYVQPKINEVMRDEVYNAIVDIIQERIQSDVYGAYSPSVYERRGSGGLGDRSNFDYQDVTNSSIFIRNIAEPNESVFGTAYSPPEPTTFARWINYGLSPMLYRDKKGNLRASTKRSPARPFMDNAREDLKSGKQHEKAFIEGMKKRGFTITKGLSGSIR